MNVSFITPSEKEVFSRLQRFYLDIKAKYSAAVHQLTDDIVSTVGAGVMLEQPGVHTFLMKPVSTGDHSQLL